MRIEDVKPRMILARDDLPYPQGAVEVLWDDATRCAPLGGGLVMRLAPLLAELSFHEVTAQDKAVPEEPGWFCIEGGEVYPGYHTRGSWNGWAMPAFEFDVAKRICETSGFAWWHYHKEDDTFYTFWEDNAEDGIEGVYAYKGRVICLTDKRGVLVRKLVYDIGDGWCWDLEDCEGCQKPGREPHRDNCFVFRDDEIVDKGMIRVQRLRDIKGLWDQWGFGDNEEVSEPLYNWLKAEIERGA